MLDRHLPNGWRIVLPNEIYVTADGKSFDVGSSAGRSGCRIFSKDLSSKRDPALEKALALLTSD
jgi:hypothetical protein